jgi:hypothetical protein
MCPADCIRTSLTGTGITFANFDVIDRLALIQITVKPTNITVLSPVQRFISRETIKFVLINASIWNK